MNQILIILIAWVIYNLGVVSGIALVYSLMKRKEENIINYPIIEDEYQTVE